MSLQEGNGSRKKGDETHTLAAAVQWLNGVISFDCLSISTANPFRDAQSHKTDHRLVMEEHACLNDTSRRGGYTELWESLTGDEQTYLERTTCKYIN